MAILLDFVVRPGQIGDNLVWKGEEFYKADSWMFNNI
jgi:hypothetical protein